MDPGDKGRARPEAASRQSDLSVAQNEVGNGIADGSSTIGAKYAGVGKDISPEVTSGTRMSDGTNVKGSESCHKKHLWCQLQSCRGGSWYQSPLY